MAANLQSVAQLLEATLDPKQNKQGMYFRVLDSDISWCLLSALELKVVLLTQIPSRTAEIAILHEEKKPGFSLLLMQIVANPSYPYTTRLASALCFKNFVKRNWTVRCIPFRPQKYEAHVTNSGHRMRRATTSWHKMKSLLSNKNLLA